MSLVSSFIITLDVSLYFSITIIINYTTASDEYKAFKTKLQFVRIFFDTPTFDRITKDSRMKAGDIISAVGGTMGLLTGFSVISAVEILCFIFKGLSFVLKLK